MVKTKNNTEIDKLTSSPFVNDFLTQSDFTIFLTTLYFFRFSDFLGLHEKLSEKYRQNGRIIPPAPDKNVVGTTKIKMSQDTDDAQNEVIPFS